MIVLKATCENGHITLLEPLPKDLEGKQIQVIVQELPASKKRRRSGSAKGQIWMAPSFDDPLGDFQEYMA